MESNSDKVSATRANESTILGNSLDQQCKCHDLLLESNCDKFSINDVLGWIDCLDGVSSFSASDDGNGRGDCGVAPLLSLSKNSERLAFYDSISSTLVLIELLSIKSDEMWISRECTLESFG